MSESNGQRTPYVKSDPDETPEVDVIRPDEGGDGWRLHLYRGQGESNMILVDEQVLPEKVTDPNAHRVLASMGRVMLTDAEARWLRDHLNKMLRE